jgi:type III secretion protein J
MKDLLGKLYGISLSEITMRFFPIEHIRSIFLTMQLGLESSCDKYKHLLRSRVKEKFYRELSMCGRWCGSLFRLLSVTVLLGIVMGISGCTSRKTIINGLEERDANEIMVFLASKGIDAYKVRAVSEGPGGGGGPALYDISVDSERATDAMAILNANGLPRRRGQKLLDLFSSGGLVPSETQEKIRYQSGLSEQIAGTIRKIDGILDADVQLSFPEEDALNPKAQKAPVTASVFVKHNGVLDDPNSQLIPKIRRLVAGSVQGLNFENVTVIPDRARFSESASQLRTRVAPESVELVRVWTIPVAKESVTRFQTLFISLIALTGVFVLSTFWLLWKIIPVARECGGLSSIFSIHPLAITEEGGEEEKAPGTPSDEEKKPPEDKGPKVQENVESP